jgi:hypothetical protein
MKANILEAMNDPALFGPWFSAPSWNNWEGVLAAAFNHGLTEVYSEVSSNRQTCPSQLKELWAIVGRRGGKSLIGAFLATYHATCLDWRPYLTPGEKALVTCLACDKAQAGVTFSYIRAFLEGIRLLRPLVSSFKAEEIELSNGISIVVSTNSYRLVRGRTVVCAILDEICFWRSEESATPDIETIRALKPAMATVPGSILVCISSPYARRGAAWSEYSKNFGKESKSKLIVQAPSKLMNPTLSDEVIGSAYEEDPASAASEFGAQFRTDIESFISLEAVEQCVVPGRIELAPCDGITYKGFCDPAGGSGSDSMTLGISHSEKGGLAVLDLIREVRPKFSPSAVVEEFAERLKAYRVTTIEGDRYAGSWPAEQFSKCGITYRPSERDKSSIYRDALPLLNSGKLELLDLPRLKAQLCGLERRTRSGGRDSIDHPLNSHDDIVNGSLGALLMAASTGAYQPFVFSGAGDPATPGEPKQPDLFSASIEQQRRRWR